MLKKKRIYTKLIKIFAITLFALSASYSLESKDDYFMNLKGHEQQQFRLAESYQADGKHEEATQILKEIFDVNPTNDLVFNTLCKSYDFLHRYSDLLPIIENFTKKKPSTESLSKLANIYWKLGETDKADNTWQLILKKYGTTPTVYIYVSTEQVSLRQYEKSIKTLLAGRDKFNTPDLYAEYLSRYYPMVGDYEAGIEEIIKLAINPSKAAYAKGRLYLYIDSEEVQNTALQALNKAIEKYPVNYTLLDSYAWYMKLIKNYDEAFEAYKKIDKMKNSKGRDLYSFAYSSQRDGEHKIAQKVYQYIIDDKSMKNQHPSALYGMTKSMEQLLLIEKDVTESDYKNIIKQYDNIANTYPNNSRAYESQYNAATILYKNLNDNSGAIKRLEKLIAQSRNVNIKTQAIITLGEIYILEEDNAKAKHFFNKALSLKNTQGEMLNAAKYNLALIEYFSGNADSARVKFNEVAEKLESEQANNAIELSALIESNISDTKALDTYRAGDYYLYLNNREKAIKNYMEVPALTTNDVFAQKALVKTIYIYKAMQDTNSQQKVWKKILDDYPKGIYTDLAIFEYAQILQGEKKLDESMKYYTMLLMDFPRSIYVPEARKKARILRDKLKEDELNNNKK